MKRKTISLLVSLMISAAFVSIGGVAFAAKLPFSSVPENNIYIDYKDWWGGGDTGLPGGDPVELNGADPVEISEGTEVTWTNYDGIHDLHIEDATTGEMVAMSMDDLKKGDSWSFTFDVAGEYVFHCHRHGNSMEHVHIVVE